MKKNYKINVQESDCFSLNVKEIKISTLDNTYCNTITISDWATGNCQVSTIGFIQLLVNLKGYKNIYKSDLNLLEDDLIKVIRSKTRRQCIIDIQFFYRDYIINIFKRNASNFGILVETPYTNSTNNSMVLIMFKWDMEDYDDNEEDYEDNEYDDEDDDY